MYIKRHQKTISLSKPKFRAIVLPQRPALHIFQELLFCLLAKSRKLVLNVVTIEAGQYL